jgi:predicted ATPase
MALCAEHGFAQFLAYSTVLRGAAITNQERFEEGIAQMREGLAAIRASGAGLSRPDLLRMLAEAYMNTGRLDDGLSALQEALAVGEETEDGQNESERHRLKGELLLKKDNLQTLEAENCFRRALEIARKQSAKNIGVARDDESRAIAS